MALKMKIVYVLTQEHYHFPPIEDPDVCVDMVAATPIQVRAGTDTGRIGLKQVARHLAEKHATKFDGEVREHHQEGRECYRVWVKSKNAFCDNFVWVVRRVDYVG